MTLLETRSRATIKTPAGLSGAILAIALALLVVPPLFVLIQTSLSSDGGPTLAHYAEQLFDPKLGSSAANSLIFAFSAMLVSVSIGACLAWLVERTNTPLRGLVHITAIVSLGTPYVLYVGAWLFLLGRSGPFNQLYTLVTGSRELWLNVYSMWGMIVIEGLLWSPLVFLLLSPVFRRSNADFEEAARISGASVAQTMWCVSLRLALPAILGIAMFVFIRNLESFDVPVLIGMPGRVNLLTTDIYQDMTRIPPELGKASAFSVVLVFIVAGLLLLAGWLGRDSARFATITGKAFRPRSFDLGRGKWVGTAIVVLVFLIVLVLPMGALLWTSLLPFVRPINLAGLSFLTLDNYASVLTDGSYIGYAVNTFAASALAATAAMLLTGAAGWFVVRRRPFGQTLDQLANMPLVFPGIILGIALLQLSLRSPLPIYGTVWLLAIGFTIRYMPYGMRYSTAGVMQIHRELEEAGAVAGASQASILRRIVAPMLSPAFVTGWLFIFLLGAKELSMAVLLAGPNSQTMAVALFNEMINGQVVEVSALGIVWTIVLTAFAVILHLFNRRYESIS
jgi:iron(III) transport system permease protein